MPAWAKQTGTWGVDINLGPKVKKKQENLGLFFVKLNIFHY